jgi:hypothetical protein
MSSRVSLAELIDSDVPLRPDGAVAVLREVCRQYVAGDLHGIPNATVIRLTPDGGVVVEGPVNRDLDPVTAAATLLTDLLPGFETPTGFKVPGGLRLVIARAMQAIDLPPFSGIAEFSEALSRFSAPDLGDTVGGLFRAWAARHAVSPESSPGRGVTISDIRRARRATGLSLEDVARACSVPAWRLRELEWGYMRNWTADDRGRQDLCAYARAAGLDTTLVVDVAWSLMESTEAVPAAAIESDSVPASVPADSWTLVPTLPLDIAAPLPWRNSAAERTKRAIPERYRWVLALAAAAIIAISAIATGWERPLSPVAAVEAAKVQSEPPVTGPADDPLNARSTSDARSTSVARPTLDAPRMKNIRPASYVSPAAARVHTVKAKPRPAPQHKSFLKRVLFRIVIK